MGPPQGVSERPGPSEATPFADPEPDRPLRPATTEGAGLVIESLEVSIGGVNALHDVSLSVSAGSVHGLIGPNGAGKTTLLNCVSGFRTPDSGIITMDGSRLERAADARSRRGLRRTFQQPVLVDHQTAMENVLAGIDTERRTSALAYVLRLPSARR